MEHVYPRVTDSGISELYLRENGKSRTAYFPGDIDRSFWQVMCADHGTILANTIRWALNEEPVVEVTGPGVVDVTVWKQENSMTVHLVNLSNPMMMKGPFRELLPVSARVKIRLPEGYNAKSIRLLSGQKPESTTRSSGVINLKIGQITDHEIIAIDLA